MADSVQLFILAHEKYFLFLAFYPQTSKQMEFSNVRICFSNRDKSEMSISNSISVSVLVLFSQYTVLDSVSRRLEV